MAEAKSQSCLNETRLRETEEALSSITDKVLARNQALEVEIAARNQVLEVKIAERGIKLDKKIAELWEAVRQLYNSHNLQVDEKFFPTASEARELDVENHEQALEIKVESKSCEAEIVFDLKQDKSTTIEQEIDVPEIIAAEHDKSPTDSLCDMNAIAKKTVTTTNAVRDEETNPKKTVMLDSLQEIEAKDVMKPIELEEMEDSVQDCESQKAIKPKVKASCISQSQVLASVLEPNLRYNHSSRFFLEKLQDFTERINLLQAGFGWVMSQNDALQMFDEMLMEKQKLQQMIRLNLLPKTWKFKFKTSFEKNATEKEASIKLLRWSFGHVQWVFQLTESLAGESKLFYFFVERCKNMNDYVFVQEKLKKALEMHCGDDLEISCENQEEKLNMIIEELRNFFGSVQLQLSEEQVQRSLDACDSLEKEKEARLAIENGQAGSIEEMLEIELRIPFYELGLDGTNTTPNEESIHEKEVVPIQVPFQTENPSVSTNLIQLLEDFGTDLLPMCQQLQFRGKLVMLSNGGSRLMRSFSISDVSLGSEAKAPPWSLRDKRSPNGAYSTGFKPSTHQEFIRSRQIHRWNYALYWWSVSCKISLPKKDKLCKNWWFKYKLKNSQFATALFFFQNLEDKVF